jgi:hypothetical protein
VFGNISSIERTLKFRLMFSFFVIKAVYDPPITSSQLAVWRNGGTNPAEKEVRN